MSVTAGVPRVDLGSFPTTVDGYLGPGYAEPSRAGGGYRSWPQPSG